MKKKGMTLVEVLVASSIFLISFAVICSTYLLATKGERKQREYIQFETICLNIDEYSDEFHRSWANKYFNLTGYEALNEFSIYFDSSYKVASLENAKYRMDFVYGDFNKDDTLLEMKVNIIKLENDYYIINDLIYGSRGGRYEA